MVAKVKPASLKAVHDFQRSFCAHIRTQGELPAPLGTKKSGVAAYRRLVLNNVSGFLVSCFPVLQTIVSKKMWRQWISEYFADHLSQTPYFREIPEEFLIWAKKQVRQKKIPPVLYALAHWEWVELWVSQAPRKKGKGKGWKLDPTAMLEKYNYPVHTFSAKTLKLSKPALEQPTYLLSWRDPNEKVQFMELSQGAHQLLKSLKPTKSVTKKLAIPNEAVPMMESLERLGVVYRD